jgi:hypothetical protein
MKKEYDVVVAGYTCVDLIPGFKKQGEESRITDFLNPGKLIEIGGLDFILGGVVPNTGLAMKKFSKRVFFNGLIGNDFKLRVSQNRRMTYCKIFVQGCNLTWA